MTVLRKKPCILYSAIIAVCFLYTGSAYMSEFYRLMNLYDGVTVDLITGVWFYLLQALGIGIFALGLAKKPEFFGKRIFFAILLATGSVFMTLAQVISSPTLITVFSCVFQLHIGIYFGYYLTMLSKYIPAEHAGLCYGTAYAIGSIGTYLFSLIRDGSFFESKEISLLYLGLAAITILLVMSAENINSDNEKSEAPGTFTGLGYLIPIVAIIMIISSIGSGLYYSIPQAENVNWNLIRAAYALGLILAGFIMDRKHLVGEICAIASLAYPLIAIALINGGVTNTLALSLSYICRGFVSVYYIILFTDMGRKNDRHLPFAPLGLMTSRLTEAVFTIFILYIPMPKTFQMILSTLCFVPLLLIFVMYQIKKLTILTADNNHDKQTIDFSEKYKLTARETEILNYMANGLSDEEIAEKCFISKNTVRFHISNIFKKTGLTSRIDVIRSLKIH
ncbi:MAG: LuxR C-terminal-related transcriptional regulator [Lachnospiraceae bacterium]|nr:LuxR C-terminal-related transcriptional regulator [Lachnospiraceae bacterium]